MNFIPLYYFIKISYIIRTLFADMKSQAKYYLIAIFSIFLGSQITEGFILLPYWQSLSASEFYSYYEKFGPSIGQFYTILTITAALIPIALSIYYMRTKSSKLRYSLISTLFAILFVACFYIYFKGTNELFYQSAFNEEDLRRELVTWGKWHWGRVIIESLSLVFLILAVSKNK